MGVIQGIKDGFNTVDQKVNPLRQVGDVLEAAGNPGQKGLPEAIERSRTYPRALGIDKTKPEDTAPKPPEKPVPGTTAAAPGESGVQKLDKGLNWVPVEKRAKGGPVKAGGAPMKNVDNSGMTKEKC